MSGPETPESIWNKISNNAKKVCVVLGPGVTQTSLDPDQLVDIAGPEVDTESGLAELRQFGVLQEVTYLQELKEKLESLPAPEADWYLRPTQISEGNREYISIKGSLDAYDKDPEKHASWEEPRLRLEPQLKKYLSTIFKR